jgi:O-methyltransferase involved in polyketide biosynthesis
MNLKKINLNYLDKIPGTMLLTLQAKYLESKHPHGIIKDQKIEEIYSHIDFDFKKFKFLYQTRTAVSIRTKIIDDIVINFAKKHKKFQVINFAAGLDTRYHRLGLNKKNIECYDIDFPGIINIRKNFFKTSKYHKLVSCNALDPHWTKITNKNIPTLFIGEGLSMYLTKSQNTHLLKLIKHHYPEAELIFDIISKVFIGKEFLNPSFHHLKAKFYWGANSGKDYEKLFNKVRVISEESIYNRYSERWGVFSFMKDIKGIQNLFDMKVCHLKFY